jgi:hypothetical protein
MAMITVARPDDSDAGPRVYADVSHVAFTPYDFRITFSLLPSPRGSSGLPIETPEAMVEVVLPPAAVEALVDTLRAEFDRFVEEFGAPRPSVQVSTAQA